MTLSLQSRYIILNGCHWACTVSDD